MHKKNSTTRLAGIGKQQEMYLISKLAEGDEHAFNDVMRLTQRALYQLVWRFMRDHDETNDVLQETYIRIFQHRKRLDPMRPIYPYIRRIAYNLAVNRYHQRQKLVRMNDMSELAHAPTDEGQDDLRQVDIAMAGLSDKFREVLILRSQQELSYKEIADVLDVRVGTVMSRLARARAALKKALSRHTPASSTESKSS